MNLAITPQSAKNNLVKKSNIYGILGSTLSCVTLFLILWFVVLPVVIMEPAKEDEGLMVSFGNSDDGGGMGSSNKPLATPTTEQLPTLNQPQKQTPVKEQLITQNDNSNEIAEQKLKIQEKKEKQLINQQKIETDKRIAQQRKNEQDAISKANGAVNGLFSNGYANSGTGNGKGSGNGTGNGSGNGDGDGIQGNPAGHGNLGGNSWSLSGRSLIGNLVKPRYESATTGKITVEIIVDMNGNVSAASISTPTTISDADIRNDALIAARKALFSKGKEKGIGKITFNYINN